MKSQKKAKEDGDAQLYKFRPRLIMIEDILVGDMSQLSDLDSDGPLKLENEEILMQQEFTEMVQYKFLFCCCTSMKICFLLKLFIFQKKSAKEDEAKEEEWDFIFDNILKSMVLVHNELFGSSDLVEQVSFIYSFARFTFHMVPVKSLLCYFSFFMS